MSNITTQSDERWVVGKWVRYHPGQHPTFVPDEEQPEKPIMDLKKIVAWVHEHKQPGPYHLVKKAPGRIVVPVQTTMETIMERRT